MEGAYYNGQYLNRLERLGYSQAEIDNKLESTFEEMFYGPEGVRLCHCAGPDMMYIEDTGNHDVRTEGMSYAMMFCVQMNRQKEFDCLWRWVVTHMYLTEGENAGYFAWSCHTDGSKNSDGPAPDGEEFFAMSLFLRPTAGVPAKGYWITLPGHGASCTHVYTKAKKPVPDFPCGTPKTISSNSFPTVNLPIPLIICRISMNFLLCGATNATVLSGMQPQRPAASTCAKPATPVPV